MKVMKIKVTDINVMGIKVMENDVMDTQGDVKNESGKH